MVNFELNPNAVLSDEERKMLARAKELPVVYDENSPELTSEMEKKFIAARMAKPRYDMVPASHIATAAEFQKAVKRRYIVLSGSPAEAYQSAVKPELE